MTKGKGVLKSITMHSYVKKRSNGEYVGAGKLWGTRKHVCQEEVRDFLQQKSEFADKGEVERVCVEGGSRTRWWFWVKGEEEVLVRLDAVDWGEY